MAAAAAKGHLERAAAVELQDIDATTAANYLTRVQLDPLPPEWSELTECLRQAPDGSMAQALSTPLTLTLVRDTYREGDLREFLDFCAPDERAISRDDIVDHLLDRVLPAAYARRPGHPPLAFDLQTAQHALGRIAGQMNSDGTRDLRWWHIPRWVPSAPRVLTVGLVVGLVVGLMVGLAFGPVAGSGAGLVAGLWAGLVIGTRGQYPRRIRQGWWREAFRAEDLVTGLVIEFTGGLALGLVIGFLNGAPILGLIFGLIFGLVFMAGGLLGQLVVAFGQPGVDHTSPVTPLTSWRNDRKYWLVVGLGNGLALGLTAGLVVNAWFGLAAGLLFGTVAAYFLSLMEPYAPATWSASLAFVQLTIRWQTPVRLMRFLEDARQRNVLRTVGPVYQFRHARLQDQLAKQALTTGQNNHTPQA